MSKERARRREQRERETAVRAAARAVQAERSERRAARRKSLAAVLPRSRGRQTGALAERRRRQSGMTLAIVLAVNVLAFAFLPEWSARAMVAVVSILAAPVLHTLLFRR